MGNVNLNKYDQRKPLYSGLSQGSSLTVCCRAMYFIEMLQNPYQNQSCPYKYRKGLVVWMSYMAKEC